MRVAGAGPPDVAFRVGRFGAHLRVNLAGTLARHVDGDAGLLLETARNLLAPCFVGCAIEGEVVGAGRNRAGGKKGRDSGRAKIGRFHAFNSSQFIRRLTNATGGTFLVFKRNCNMRGKHLVAADARNRSRASCEAGVWEAAHGSDVFEVIFIDALPCAAGVFSPAGSRPIASDILEAASAQGDRRPELPARPSGRHSNTTLAWMEVVYTRSHKQAARGSMREAGGVGINRGQNFAEIAQAVDFRALKNIRNSNSFHSSRGPRPESRSACNSSTSLARVSRLSTIGPCRGCGVETSSSWCADCRAWSCRPMRRPFSPPPAARAPASRSEANRFRSISLRSGRKSACP